MTDFKDKERSEEKKYALDQEREFKIIARRNKLLGLWAAEQMNLPEDKAHAYAKAVVLSDFEEPGDEDVFRKIQSDLKAAGVSVQDEQIRHQMIKLLQAATQQLEAE